MATTTHREVPLGRLVPGMRYVLHRGDERSGLVYTVLSVGQPEQDGARLVTASLERLGGTDSCHYWPGDVFLVLAS